MKKTKSAYGKPYIRRLTNKDIKYGIGRTSSFYEYVKLLHPQYKYVLVQRGTNNIISVGVTKNDLKRRMLVVRKNKDFSSWCNRIKKFAQSN